MPFTSFWKELLDEEKETETNYWNDGIKIQELPAVLSSLTKTVRNYITFLPRFGVPVCFRSPLSIYSTYPHQQGANILPRSWNRRGVNPFPPPPLLLS